MNILWQVVGGFPYKLRKPRNVRIQTDNANTLSIENSSKIKALLFLFDLQIFLNKEDAIGISEMERLHFHFLKHSCIKIKFFFWKKNDISIQPI